MLSTIGSVASQGEKIILYNNMPKVIGNGVSPSEDWNYNGYQDTNWTLGSAQIFDFTPQNIKRIGNVLSFYVFGSSGTITVDSTYLTIMTNPSLSSTFARVFIYIEFTDGTIQEIYKLESLNGAGYKSYEYAGDHTYTIPSNKDLKSLYYKIEAGGTLVNSSYTDPNTNKPVNRAWLDTRTSPKYAFVLS